MLVIILPCMCKPQRKERSFWLCKLQEARELFRGQGVPEEVEQRPCEEQRAAAAAADVAGNVAGDGDTFGCIVEQSEQLEKSFEQLLEEEEEEEEKEEQEEEDEQQLEKQPLQDQQQQQQQHHQHQQQQQQQQQQQRQVAQSSDNDLPVSVECKEVKEEEEAKDAYVLLD